jgi:hypothetical protein
MRNFSLLLLLTGVLTESGFGAAPVPLYINTSPVTFADDTPQINATAFDNRSSFSVATGGGFLGSDVPFETFNTLFVTNAAAGTMSGSPGFHFDHSYQGGRGPLLNWVNRGLISGDLSVWVNSSNLVNSGRGVEAGGRGIVHLEGDKVNVSRSVIYTGFRVGGLPGGLEQYPNLDPGVAGIPPNASGFSDGTFIDNYWASRSNSIALEGLSTALTPPATVPPAHSANSRSASRFAGFLGGFLGGFPLGFGLVSPQDFYQSPTFDAFVFTNLANPGGGILTNVIQMVFVNTNGFAEGVSVEVGFSPNIENISGANWPGPGNIATVRLGLPEVDPFTGLNSTNFLELRDYLAFRGENSAAIRPERNLYLVPNFASAGNPTPEGLDRGGLRNGTARPNTYSFGAVNFLSDIGSPSNAVFDPLMIYNPDLLSNTVNAAYTAYSVSFAGGSNLLMSKLNGNNFETIPGLSGLPRDEVTNLAGRVEIKAKSLNLDRSRIRAESALIIQTDDLVGNALPNAVDSPLLSYDLRSKQSDLVVSNLVPPTVNRWAGDLGCYSAIWQSGSTNDPVTPGGTNYVTNVFMVHILVVDHNFTRTQQVLLQDLKLRGKSVVLSDTMSVAANLLIDATNLTITGQVGTNAVNIFNPPNTSLAGSNLVNLQNFTNHGNLVISRGLNMGADRSKPLSNIVNFGGLFAADIRLASDRIIQSNYMAASDGGMVLNARELNLLSGSSNQVVGDITLTANDLITTNSYIEAGAAGLNPFAVAAGGLILNVTNSISDGGPSSSNFWSINQSLVLMRAPKSGSLLGTTIYSTAAAFTEVIHSSAIPDAGPTPDAYATNLAIGRLVLDGGENCLFRFSPPPGVSNVAFYIDELVLLNNATNIADTIVVDPGVRVYFANSTPLLPQDGVNHAADDGLRWASSFAGNFSSTNISYGLLSFDLNLSLVLNANLDSDNDGIPNPSDAQPVWTSVNTDLQPPVPTNALGRRGFLLTGNALVSYNNTVYTNYATNTLEYTLDLANGPWMVLTNIVTPVANTVPPQSVPFVYFDRGPTNISRHYRMRVRVTDP